MSDGVSQWYFQWSHSLPVLPEVQKETVSPSVKYSWDNFGRKVSLDYVKNPYSVSSRVQNKFIRRKLGCKKENTWDVEPRYDYNDALRMLGAAMWLSTLTPARAQAQAQSLVVPADADTPPFHTLYKWGVIDFEFPSAQYRDEAIINRAYIPENVLPLGIEVWEDRVFVTIPSWKPGLPATLCTVPRAGGVASPLLRPYPDWTFHRYGGGDCKGLTSVFRVSADPCGRLWVLDSGQVDAVNNGKQLCPPAIVIFDLNTDRLIARYNIPKEFVLQNSLFSNILIDTRTSDCSDVHVYIADTWRFGLLVFRESDGLFWRFSHHLFFPDPLASNFTLHGVNFQWSDGIFGLALSPIVRGDRTLFFHAMSSFREFYVKTSVLRIPEAVNSSANEFHILGETRGQRGHVSASAIDRRGVMFYNLVSRDSIGCWSIKKPYLRRNLGVVATNQETLIFPNDLKIDQDSRQSVWVISNRLPLYQNGPLNPYDYNFRIMFADVEEATRGTMCDPNRFKILDKNF